MASKEELEEEKERIKPDFIFASDVCFYFIYDFFLFLLLSLF